MPRSRSRPAPSVSRAPVRPTTSQPTRSSSTAPSKPSQPYGGMQQQPQQSSGGGGLLSGFMGNVVSGMAFGTGSAIAHRAVGAVAGSMSGGEQPMAPQEVSQQQAPVQAVNSCAVDQQNFIQCLNANQGSVEACQFYFDSLNACQKGQSGFA